MLSWYFQFEQTLISTWLRQNKIGHQINKEDKQEAYQMYSVSEMNVLKFCCVGFSAPIRINTLFPPLKQIKLSAIPLLTYNILKNTLHLTPGDAGVQTQKKTCLDPLKMCLSYVCMCAVLRHFSRVQLFVTLWTVAHQAPLSMGFSRQEYWSGLPCTPLGELPNPGIKPMSLMSPALSGRFLATSATWEAKLNVHNIH